MKKILSLTAVLGFVAISITTIGTLPSCKSKKKAAKDTTAATTPARDFAAEGYTKAMVVYTELDGCNYLLQLEHDPNGADVMKRLEPTNLKEEFKKDQLLVWIKYAPKKGAMSTCMAGPIVEIQDIQLRK